MVPESSHVCDVYLNDKEGVILSNLDSKILIDCSTIDPSTSLDVRSKILSSHPSASFYDAPVSGGNIGATKATLTVMLGCSETDPNFPRLQALLSTIGSSIFPCGGPSLGLVAKLCNNYCSGLISIANAETFNLGIRAGLNSLVLHNILKTSSAQNKNQELWNPVPGIVPTSPSSQGYKGGFRVELMKKDVELAVELAGKVGAKLALGDKGLEVYEGASKNEKCVGLDSKVVYRHLGGIEDWKRE
jgi:3-hydroxyisobutyrate dehydrogenase